MSAIPPITAMFATLCDLRTQCERQLGAVIDAQRVLHDYRDQAATQSDAQQQLASDLAALASAQRVIVQLPGAAPGSSEPAVTL
jgi:hypothetical protein